MTEAFIDYQLHQMRTLRPKRKSDDARYGNTSIQHVPRVITVVHGRDDLDLGLGFGCGGVT